MTVDQLKAELKTFEDATNDNSFTMAQRVQAEKEARIIKVKLLSATAKTINNLDWGVKWLGIMWNERREKL